MSPIATSTQRRPISGATARSDLSEQVSSP
jgi:hypothetical protein